MKVVTSIIVLSKVSLIIAGFQSCDVFTALGGQLQIEAKLLDQVNYSLFTLCLVA